MSMVALVGEPEDILDYAARLNKMAECSTIVLGTVLCKIKEEESYRPEFETFDEYYKSALKRSKGDISKLLRVGRFMLDGGFRAESMPDLGYTVLYSAILSYPDKEPDYVLAAAQTQTLAELADGSRDKYGEHTPEWEAVFKCKTCGKVTSNQDSHV